ncbi:DUF4325 domain-containing protein [Yersinia enterocolitica]|uniref:STAS-like domain-containing protein n=1 Tax=Yersinia enterocolitica TaxID=630 RepID=UPI0005E1952E|nr:DUF4325 domain-containing protein [Yersinia enterocolitica]EKN3501797.1 DUF4325 domain-containing protein [Yersinia enterocolitica]EKN4062445.1 DUF4325 domain-containing protein [Yersinia enterocolitica]CQH25234.1 Uncharacterised protein [Yersinia enterocolitica]HDL7195498.1 DUF4325 domain-containing protein [Yersinia enterocolitica]HDL7388970.1 DUF4325 domain-containing protein [Yersinia enterocolitica]
MNINNDSDQVLNISEEFSKLPSGRFYSDKTGSSGEQFREEILRKKLSLLTGGQKLIIILDNGVEGYGSSFLVEGFAGIVKYGYMTSDKLLSLLEFKYSDEDFEFFKKKIIQYISEARFNSKTYERTHA